VDVDIVKLFTIPQILRDSLRLEPFVRLSLVANAMLDTDGYQSSSVHATSYDTILYETTLHPQL